MIILFILVWGMFVGWIANMILGGGSRPADWGPLLVTGLLGSFVGGLVFSLLSGDGFNLRLSGILGSILGAVLLLAGYKFLQDRKA